MRDLLRQFGSRPARARRLQRRARARWRPACASRRYAETQGYVARILGLMSGAGQPLAPGDGIGLAVRLVK